MESPRETGNRDREAAVEIEVRNSRCRRLEQAPLHEEGEAPRTLRQWRSSY